MLDKGQKSEDITNISKNLKKNWHIQTTHTVQTKTLDSFLTKNWNMQNSNLTKKNIWQHFSVLYENSTRRNMSHVSPYKYIDS